MRKLAIVFVLTAMVLASAVWGADVSLSYRSSLLWTGVHKIIAQDTLLFCPMVNGLWVLNAADPTNLTLVTQLPMERGTAMDAEMNGHLLYVVDYGGNLNVLDVSDPRHPLVAGTFHIGEDPFGLDVVDTLAYLAYVHDDSADQGGLLILNVAQPEHITPVGSLHGPDSNLMALDVTVLGDYAYCTMDASLSVVDISDPTHPSRVSYLRQFDPYGNWYLAEDIRPGPDDTLLLLANNSGMWPVVISAFSVINIADPLHPSLISEIEHDGKMSQLRLKDSIAILSNGMRGVSLINVADPAHPDTMTRYGARGTPDWFYFAGPVSVKDTLLFVSDDGPVSADVEGAPERSRQPEPSVMGTNDILPDFEHPNLGIRTVNIADPMVPTTIGKYDLPGSVTDFVPGGRYVYALYSGDCSFTDTTPDIRVIDLINPDTPIVRGTYYTPYWASDGLLVDTLLYLATGQLEVLSIADPDNPVLLGGMFTNDHVGWIVKRDNLIFAACGQYGMRIYDVTDPVHPVRLATLRTRNSAAGIAVSGNYAYIGDVYAGLAVADISDPAHPVLLPYYNNRYVVGETYLAKDGLLCSAVWGGFVLFDIGTDPSSPAIIAGCGYESEQAIAVKYPFVYVANALEGIAAVDISDPYVPRESTRMPIPYCAGFVAIDDRFMYVSNYYSVIVSDWTEITDAPGETPSDLPTQFSLDQNYPNPFNPSTTIAYDLPHRGRVRLTIYNVLGQEVTTLVDREQSAGHHTVPWRGDGFGSGMYFYRLEVDGVTESRKMLLVK